MPPGSSWRCSRGSSSARLLGLNATRFWVPNHLPRLSSERALATVRLPLTLNWSQPGREFALADCSNRARVYEIVLTEGQPDDIRRYVDGLLLVDLWPDLILPRTVRSAWAPLVDEVLAGQKAA